MTDSRRRGASIAAGGLAGLALVSMAALLAWCSGFSEPADDLREAVRVVEVRRESPRPRESARTPPEPRAAPSPEPETTPEEPATQEPTAPLMRSLVRDAATGEPVSGLAFMAGDLSLTTDPEGALLFPPDAADRLKLVPGGSWRRLPGPADETADGVRVLWVYSTMRVEGRVAAESALASLDLGKVELVAITGQPLPDGAGAPSFSLGVLRAADLDRIEFPDAIEPDGSFQATLPRIPGYRLVARSRGWEPDSAPLGTERSQRVSLTIRKPSLKVRGTLRDSTGAPLRGALVMAYVYLEFDLAELDRAAIKARGHGYTMRTNPHTRRVKLTYFLGTRTNDDGTFAFRANVKGQLTIMARAGGDHVPIFLDGRALEDDIDFGDVRARPGDGQMVRVLRCGVPYKKRIGITDLTRDVQPSFIANLGPKGEFPRAILEMGHLYAISVLRSLAFRGYLVWDGRDVLNMDALDRMPPKNR
jgi:hypothetical protein